MIRFVGGPADGRELDLERVPSYLRVVARPTLLDPGADLDALDQVDDEPASDEIVSVYRLTGRDGSMHVCRRPGGCLVAHHAEYTHMPDVDGEQLRTAEAWSSWADRRPAVVPGPLERRPLGARRIAELYDVAFGTSYAGGLGVVE